MHKATILIMPAEAASFLHIIAYATYM